MTWESSRPLMLTLALVSMVAAAPLPAQNPKRPQAYSLTLTSSPQVFKVYRNGAKERIDLDVAASPDNPKEVHQVFFFDSATHKAYAEDPASHACYSAPYPSADNLANYDPFFIPAGTTPVAMLPPGGKLIGAETVNGFATKLYEAQLTDKGITVTTKLWWSETYGFPVKIVMIVPNTPPMVTAEIKDLVITAPPATLFAAPSGCKETQGTWTPNGFELSGQKAATLGAVAAPPL